MCTCVTQFYTQSTEAIILETPSRVTLESPVIRAVSSTDQVQP